MEAEKRISTDLSRNNVDPISLFENNPGFVFVYKKTEKLVTAVYMITALFSDSEPMKWNLRKKANDFMSFILFFKDTTVSSYSDFMYSVNTHTLELVTLLE